jgi:hypothetical protein
VKETFKAQNHGGGGGERRRRTGDGRRAALIKSRDSHMAGGEQMFVCQGTQGILFRKSSRKVRERDGERDDRIEHKSSGFRQPLTWLNIWLINIYR